MQRKLKDLNAPQNAVGAQAQTAARLSQMGVSGINAPAQAAQERASLQYRKNLDTYIKDEYKKQEDLVKLMGIKERGLQRLAKAQSNATDNVEKELKIREKIAKVEENQARHRQEYAQRDQAINQAADIKEKQGQGPPSSMSKILSMVGGPLGLMAGLTGVIAGARHLSGYEQRLEAAKGTAVEGMVGKDLANVYAGRSPFEAAWMPERAQALKLAKQKADRTRMLDLSAGLLGVGSVVGGLAIGAASIAGMPFSAGGSALGIPTSLALMAAGGATLMNDSARTSVLNPQEYQNLLAAQRATDFQSNLANIKKQDPRKEAMLNHFEANFMRDIQSQRMLGLSGEGFRGNGGFLRRGVDAGFTNEMTIGMGNAIVGAGGSARMGQQSPFALQMERGGLTNAAQLMGNLSGGIQSPGASKDAMIAIMSEAFKRGLDNADYVEELRRFASVATDIVSRTGAATPEGQRDIADTLGMFLGAKTNAGVKGAQTEYEAYQQRGSELGGRRGVMRYSEALKNKNLSQLNPMVLTEFLDMRPEDLRANPSVVEFIRQEGGFKNASDVLKAHSDIQKATRFQIPGVRTAAEDHAVKVAQYMKDENIPISEMTRRSLQNVSRPGVTAPGYGLPSDISKAWGGMGIFGNVEERTKLNATEISARAGELLRNTGIEQPPESSKTTAESLMAPTGKIEDTFINDIAKSADLVRQNFDELKGVLTKASAAVMGHAEATNKNASSSNRAGSTPYTGAETQPQSTPGFFGTRFYNPDQK